MILEFAIEEDFLWAPPVLLAVDEGAAEPAAVVFSVWFADVLARKKRTKVGHQGNKICPLTYLEPMTKPRLFEFW